MMRLTMTGRAVSPDPGMAPSTQWLPVALNALANSATAAASPPDVHQWVTSRSTPVGAGLAASPEPEPALAVSPAEPEPALAVSPAEPPLLSLPLPHPGTAMMTVAANAIAV